MPKTVGFVMIPPSLYQSMDRCGTLGGEMDKVPDTRKCGSLMCGNCSFRPEKKPLTASSAERILSRAASMGVTIAVLIPFHTDVAVLLIPLNRFVAVFFTDSNAEETLLLMPSTTVEMAVLIPFQIVVAVVLMALKTVVTTVFTALICAVTVETIVFQIPEKKATIPFQMVSKKDLMPDQTDSHVLPNHPKTVSARDFSRFSAVSNRPVIPSQMPEKISFTPSHI